MRQMQLALATSYSMAGPRLEQPLERWSAHLPSRRPVALHASMRGDRGRVEVMADGAGDTLLAQLEALLAAAAEPEYERLHLGRIGERLQPARAGTWIASDLFALDGGWTFGGELPLAATLEAALPATAVVAGFADWAGSLKLRTVASLRRSIGAGNPTTELVVHAPVHGLATFASDVGIALEPRVLAVLGGAEAAAAVRIAFTAAGIARAGLRFLAPSRAAMLTVVDHPDPETDAAWAAFEGTLRSPGPAWLDVMDSGDGPFVELGYDVVALHPVEDLGEDIVE